MLSRSKWLLLLCVLWPMPGYAAQTVTFAENGTGAGQPWLGSASATVSITINPGETVCTFFGVGSTSRSVTSVSDDGGNTYSQVITRENVGAVEMWAYCANATSSATTITVTLNTSTTDRGFLNAYTVTNANGVGNSQGGTIDLSTTHDSGTVTLTGSTSTLLGCTLGSNGVYTIDADFTQDDQSTSSTVTVVCGRRASTASEAMTNTSSVNEDSATIALEVPEVSTSNNMFRRRLDR